MTRRTIELPPPHETATRRRSGGRIAAAIALALIGAVLALIGSGAVGLQLISGDEDGYLTETADLETDSYALTTGKLDLDAVAAIPDDLLGTVRIEMTPDDDRPLFVGIASAADVDRYLRGVRHAEVTEISDGAGSYVLMPGGGKPANPARQDIWAASSHGDGEQTVTWRPEEGEWKVVAMSADGSRGVAVHVEAGAKLGWLIWTGVGFLLAGLALAAAAVFLARPRRQPELTDASGPSATAR